MCSVSVCSRAIPLWILDHCYYVLFANFSLNFTNIPEVLEIVPISPYPQTACNARYILSKTNPVAKPTDPAKQKQWHQQNPQKLSTKPIYKTRTSNHRPRRHQQIQKPPSQTHDKWIATEKQPQLGVGAIQSFFGSFMMCASMVGLIQRPLEHRRMRERERESYTFERK